jgi:SAM-dependent methyltransferase
MSDPDKENARKTFADRAQNYESETGWVTDPCLLDPLVPSRDNFQNSSGRFLDICTGTGRVAQLAGNKGWIAVAVDQSVEMLSNISSNSVLAIRADAARLPFSENSFDICAMRQALHYFEPELIIEQMLRISRSEIRLGHITTHNPDDVVLWGEFFRTASPGRKHIFSPGDIANLIKKKGAEVVDQEVKFSRERFDGPIEHLGPEVVNKLRRAFLEGDPEIVSRYVNSDETNGDFTIRLRWEFQVAKLPGS